MHRRLPWLLVSITHAINIHETTLDSNFRDLAYLYRQLEYLFRSEYRQWDHPPSAADDTLVPPWDLEPLNQFPFLMAHDAATGYLDNSPEYWWAKTQTVGFGGQAACGARSFDVRPFVQGDGNLVMHHGPITVPKTVVDALTELVTFANRNHNELILVYAPRLPPPLVTRGMPSSPYLPWRHVAGTSTTALGPIVCSGRRRQSGRWGSRSAPTAASCSTRRMAP